MLVLETYFCSPAYNNPPVLFLVAYVAEFRYLLGDSEWLTMEKKKKSSGYIMVQIKFHSEELRTWKWFCDSEITLKVKLLPEIRIEKVLSVSLSFFYSW